VRSSLLQCILDDNTWKFVYACAVKDSFIDIDEFKVHMDSIPLLN